MCSQTDICGKLRLLKFLLMGTEQSFSLQPPNQDPSRDGAGTGRSDTDLNSGGGQRRPQTTLRPQPATVTQPQPGHTEAPSGPGLEESAPAHLPSRVAGLPGQGISSQLVAERSQRRTGPTSHLLSDSKSSQPGMSGSLELGPRARKQQGAG
ncbi:PREDICTED: uncharacterized protein LOC106147976 [Chinchilla lanigera]|uniref:uncharacterized protein LOC106147976 n=1 Tax=Chinchilla lanigera TaxID=34839 RepID=UPI0006964A54|nr:PREDICTED: uncharacterized protein LOC106147976 [Chinchilla lanigera]